MHKSSLKLFRIALIIVAVLFMIGTGYFFYKGYDVKNNYYYSEYSSYTQNAYVGGDAYNYIINGNYFTGYNVVGIGCAICAVICGVGAVMLTAKIEELISLDQINKSLQNQLEIEETQKELMSKTKEKKEDDEDEENENI